MPMVGMKSEDARYKTFQGSAWPSGAPVSISDLAAAGFYYIGPGDRVACFACHGCLNNWEEGDIPLREHRRVFPKCPFILGDSCGNVAIKETYGVHATDSNPTNLPHYANNRSPDQLVPSRLNIPQTGRIIHPLDIVTSKTPTPDVWRTCQHPEYALEKQRYDTYGGWSQSNPVEPLVLARAGFFYSGEGDRVTCFYCGGSLDGWQPSDDPWVEHARAFGKCEWLMQQQGPFFLEHVLQTS